jgi:4-hydroxy-L-threonine phosphate dehydrogenase PdxA
MTGWIGITLGDVTGIGPEVALKAVAAEAPTDDRRYLLIGNSDSINRLNQKSGLNLPLKKFAHYGDSGRFFVANPLAEPSAGGFAGGGPRRSGLAARRRGTLSAW